MSTEAIEKQAADEFDRWARAGRGESMARGHRAIVEPVVSRWQLGPGSAALDAGCGNGWAVRLLLERGAGAATGADISPEMVALARASGPGEFAVASSAALPFPDAAFTHVLSVESLYYTPDPAAALAELARVAAPGAELAVIIELFAENRGTAVWAEALDVPVHLLSEQRWAAMAQQAGWTDVRTERVRRPEAPLPEAAFSPSRWTPTWAHHVDALEQGALAILARRPE